MIDFSIAPAGLGDVDRIYEIECASFSIPWSKESFASLLSNREHTLCVTARAGKVNSAESAGTAESAKSTESTEPPAILGYVGVMHVLDEGEITNIAVHPESRGQGVGFSLLRAAQEYCRQTGVHTLHLEVRPSNTNAIALYRKCGFVQSGMRRGYYADNREDALLYTWKDV